MASDSGVGETVSVGVSVIVGVDVTVGVEVAWGVSVGDAVGLATGLGVSVGGRVGVGSAEPQAVTSIMNNANDNHRLVRPNLFRMPPAFKANLSTYTMA